MGKSRPIHHHTGLAITLIKEDKKNRNQTNANNTPSGPSTRPLRGLNLSFPRLAPYKAQVLEALIELQPHGMLGALRN
jgi:hypothetical protein